MKRHLTEIAILLAILSLAIFVRMVNLSDNPGWYTDEGTHLNIAEHLLSGHSQYMAVGDSTLLFARLPLFEIILASTMHIFGTSIATLRTLTALLGVLSVALLSMVIRCLTGRKRLALIATLVLAIYPQAVLYSRFGFSYNLLTPLLLLVLLGLGLYVQQGKQFGLWLACLATGLGTLSDLMMLAIAAAVIGIILICNWRHLGIALPLILLPFTTYLLAMAAQHNDTFWYDVAYTQTRVSGIDTLTQFRNISHNLTVLANDGWFLGGIIGLWILKPRVLAVLCLVLLIGPILIIGRTVALYHLTAYYLIPLLPLVALGLGALLETGLPFIWTSVRDFSEHVLSKNRLLPHWLIRGVPVAVISLTLIPISYTLDRSMYYAQHTWPTAIDSFLVPPDDARAVVDYVNARVQPDETVVVSPGIAWLLEAQPADFSMAPATFVDDSVRLWNDIRIPRTRLRYDPRYTAAHYVIVDPLWRTWGVNTVEGVADMLSEIETNWRPVYQHGQLTVFANPQPTHIQSMDK